MRKSLWMGPLGFERWVPMPKIDMDRSRRGFAADLAYENGGGRTVRSKSSQGRVTLTWSNKTLADLAVIEAMAAGAYDPQPGVNPIYISDPSAWLNCLPRDLTVPAVDDVMPLVIGARRPKTAAFAGIPPRDFPARVATYDFPGTARETYVPIPPGMALHFGAHGTRTGTGRVRVTPYVGGTPQTPVYPALLSTTPLTNTVFSSQDVTGVSIAVDATSPTNRLNLFSMIGRMLPVGSPAPDDDAWTIGRGLAGCAFTSTPSETLRSVALAQGRGMSTLTATLAEESPWY